MFAHLRGVRWAVGLVVTETRRCDGREVTEKPTWQPRCDTLPVPPSSQSLWPSLAGEGPLDPRPVAGPSSPANGPGTQEQVCEAVPGGRLRPLLSAGFVPRFGVWSAKTKTAECRLPSPSSGAAAVPARPPALNGATSRPALGRARSVLRTDLWRSLGWEEVVLGTTLTQDRVLRLSCGAGVSTAARWVSQSLPPPCSRVCSLLRPPPVLSVSPQTPQCLLPQSCTPARSLWLREPAAPHSSGSSGDGVQGQGVGRAGPLGAPSSPASRVSCLPWLCPHISLPLLPGHISSSPG